MSCKAKVKSYNGCWYKCFKCIQSQDEHFLCAFEEKKDAALSLCADGAERQYFVSEAFDKNAEKYSQVIERLEQWLENKFCDLGQLEPCVSFICNPFMNMDISSIAEQLSATFSLDAGQMELEIVKLQNDLHLKAYQCAPNFRGLVDTEKYSGVRTAALEVASLFGSTYHLWINLFWHELLQEQTQNTSHRCTSARLTQSCSVKLHTRVQHTSGEHAMSDFPLTDKQTDTRFGVKFKICHSWFVKCVCKMLQLIAQLLSTFFSLAWAGCLLKMFTLKNTGTWKHRNKVLHNDINVFPIFLHC